mgnify:CR=1 FL=1
MDVIAYRGVLITDSQVLKKVINQLNKDLALSGLSYRFLDTINYNSFYKEFMAWIESAIIKNEALFIGFLYRVDIKEQELKKNKQFDIKNLAKSVLERELQKIILRRKIE